MIKIYGIAASRAFRPLWLLEELGLAYEHIPLDYRGSDLASADYRRLNPNCRVPTLVDGELVLWESMAINLYLASRYGRDAGLWPSDTAGEGLAYQWSFWVMCEMEAALLTLLCHRRLLPAEERDPDKASRNEGIVSNALAILEQSLTKQSWLADDHFTVADLNVAAVLAWAKPAKLRLAQWPRLNEWLSACLQRPAAKTAQRR